MQVPFEDSFIIVYRYEIRFRILNHMPLSFLPSDTPLLFGKLDGGPRMGDFFFFFF